MPDDSELSLRDPSDLLDEEAARLDTFFFSVSGEGWLAPTRCAGWSVRDLLGHLLGAEEYFHACLDGSVPALIEGYGRRGSTSLDEMNALGVADYAALSPSEALERWRRSSGETRSGFRARGDGVVDTSIGEYPARWQAFHAASEWATHADDLGAPVADSEREARIAWRAAISRFALAEAKPELEVRRVGERTIVVGKDAEVSLDDEQLIDTVAARAGDELAPSARRLLSVMPE